MGEMEYNYKTKILKQYLINIILYDQIYIEIIIKNYKHSTRLLQIKMRKYKKNLNELNKFISNL